MSTAYRTHRLRAGDEWVLTTLAKGNARFTDGKEQDWLPPLGSAETAQFVSDPDTICLVAIENETNQIAGFVYGGVLMRRHTRLQHICLYEIGIDIDHRTKGVGSLLLAAFGAEARAVGIDRGFVLVHGGDGEMQALLREFGGQRSEHVIYGLTF